MRWKLTKGKNGTYSLIGICGYRITGLSYVDAYETLRDLSIWYGPLGQVGEFTDCFAPRCHS